MSRLIDADVLIERIYEYQSKAIDTDDVIHSIKTMPVAYDVEEVVAELKEKKDEASIKAGKRSVRIGEDEYEDDPYYEGKKHAYVHAIDIVKTGGV